MKSTKDDAYKAAGSKSAEKKETKSKATIGNDVKPAPKSQGPGTTGRRKPPPPTDGNLTQDQS